MKEVELYHVKVEDMKKFKRGSKSWGSFACAGREIEQVLRRGVFSCEC